MGIMENKTSEDSFPNINALYGVAGVFWCAGAMGIYLFREPQLQSFAAVLIISSIVIWNVAAICNWESTRRNFRIRLAKLLQGNCDDLYQ